MTLVKKLSAGAAIGALGVSLLGTPPAHAQENAVGNSSPTLQKFSIGNGNEYFDVIDKVKEHFILSEDGELGLDRSVESLAGEFLLTQNEMNALTKILELANEAPSSVASNGTQMGVSSQDGARIFYLDSAALTTGLGAALLAASQVSPAALMAAWTAFSAAVGGPIAIGSALLGGAFFLDLSAKIIGAHVQWKGVAFYATWGVPPLKAEIE